jgi:iron complex outermembrane receptor protein
MAAFRYWYKDLQIFDIVNEENAIPTSQLLNSDAKVLGFEAELELQPIEGLNLKGSFAWLDSEFIDFQVKKTIVFGSKTTPGQLSTLDYSGNPLIAAPEWSAAGIAEYEISTRWGSLIPSYDFSYKSHVYHDPQMREMISQRGYWLHNARLAYRTPDGKLEFAGWVRNFLEQTYKTDIFDLTNEFSSIQEIWGEPRTYGFTISYLW